MVLNIVECPLTGRISSEGAQTLKNFLIEHGMWNGGYLAFSMHLGYSVDASELEKRLADTGKVNCDVLGTGELSHCQTGSFMEGKSAIVIYAREKLRTKDNEKFKRPQGNPSEYVAMVIMPKVQ